MRKRRPILTFAISLLGVYVLMVACNSDSGSEPTVNDDQGSLHEGGEPQTIMIGDQTGKQWDITHAVNHYGMEARKFTFGLGPYYFKPVMEPEFLVPGDSGYPAASDTFQVIATIIDGEARAYPTSTIFLYEVVDDQFPESGPIAITW